MKIKKEKGLFWLFPAGVAILGAIYMLLVDAKSGDEGGFVFIFLLLAILALISLKVVGGGWGLCFPAGLIGLLVGMFPLYIPIFLANSMPIILAKTPGLRNWDTPVWKKLLGVNKTWRGWLGGTLAGGVTGIILYLIVWELSFAQSFYLGCQLGFVALVGDMLGSLIKRLCGKEPGEEFWLDKVDYILATILFLRIAYPDQLIWSDAILLIFATSVANIAVNIVAYRTSMKDVPH